MTFTFDTNAGPIFTVDQASVPAMRRFVENGIPLLRKRGYTSNWTRSGDWHVVNCYNSKGRLVHAAAFKKGTLR